MLPRHRRRFTRPPLIAWSKVILLGLLKVSGEFATIMLSTPYKGAPTILPRRRPAYCQAYRRLERSGLVVKTSNTKQRYVLTKTGRRRAIELLVRSQATRRQRWDGRWRVFIFDIPERRRAARDFLRRHLRLIGFRKLHQSVWVSPYDAPPAFQELVAETGLRFHSRLLVVAAMDYDRDLRKAFGLPSGRHLRLNRISRP